MNNERNGRQTFSKIINIVMWVVILVWLALCLTDFYKTQNEKDPMFCIKKETIKYQDGKVDYCLGVGYKIYHYNRKSIKGYEYGPFWSKEKTGEESK